jgi:hypothetical protein
VASGQQNGAGGRALGETLRSRLSRERQLPVADSVRIAREVAEALD